MTYIIDDRLASNIAVEFLQQYNSVIKAEKPVIEKEGNWLVTVTISAPIPKKFEVKINAKTGFVMGYVVKYCEIMSM